MSIISMILVVFVAFLAGMEGILDEFQFHQPLVACTLIGLVTGNLEAGIVLGGTLQNDRSWLSKYRSCCSTRCCIGISCICNYFSIRWSRCSRRSISYCYRSTTCCCWFVLNNDRTYNRCSYRSLDDAAAEEGNIRKVENVAHHCSMFTRYPYCKFLLEHYYSSQLKLFNLS